MKYGVFGSPRGFAEVISSRLGARIIDEMTVEIGEIFVALYLESAALLMLVATMKGILVVKYYMHVSRLWTPEEEH